MPLLRESDSGLTLIATTASDSQAMFLEASRQGGVLASALIAATGVFGRAVELNPSWAAAAIIALILSVLCSAFLHVAAGYSHFDFAHKALHGEIPAPKKESGKPPVATDAIQELQTAFRVRRLPLCVGLAQFGTLLAGLGLIAVAWVLGKP